VVLLVIFEVGYIRIAGTDRCVIAHGFLTRRVKEREAVSNSPEGELQRQNLRV